MKKSCFLSINLINLCYFDCTANVELADAYVTKTQEDMDNWQQEVLKRLDQEQDFIAKLRKRRQHSNCSSANHSDNENDK